MRMGVDASSIVAPCDSKQWTLQAPSRIAVRTGASRNCGLLARNLTCCSTLSHRLDVERFRFVLALTAVAIEAERIPVDNPAGVVAFDADLAIAGVLQQ